MRGHDEESREIKDLFSQVFFLRFCSAQATPYGTPFFLFNLIRDLSIQTITSNTQLVVFPII